MRTRIAEWYSRRPGVVLSVAAITALALIGSIAVFVAPSNSGRAAIESRDPDPRIDRLPTGIEATEKGVYQGLDSQGDKFANFGVLLENRGDSPVVMRVSFALFATEEHPDPWWEGPSEDDPLWVTIFPGEEVGLGDAPEFEEGNDNYVGRIRVTGEADDDAAKSLGEAGPELRATPTKRQSSDTEGYSELTFDVENGYDQSITDAGFGMVYRDPESEEIVGGWYKRSGDDDSVPDGVDAEYIEGKSTHTVGIRSAPAAVDVEDIEIYMWP